jgi:uncharacterized Zn finger protein
MPSVADLVEEADLRRLADSETYARGVELAERVRMSAFGPQRVAGTVVAGEEPATVELRVEGDALAWSCSAGDASAALICPHVIAVAVETRRRAPQRRS